MPNPKDYTVDPFSKYYAHSLDLPRIDQMPAPGTPALSLAAVYEKFLTPSAFLYFFPHSQLTQDESFKKKYRSQLVDLPFSQDDIQPSQGEIAKVLAAYRQQKAAAENDLQNSREQDQVLAEYAEYKKAKELAQDKLKDIMQLIRAKDQGACKECEQILEENAAKDQLTKNKLEKQLFEKYLTKESELATCLEYEKAKASREDRWQDLKKAKYGKYDQAIKDADAELKKAFIDLVKSKKINFNSNDVEPFKEIESYHIASMLQTALLREMKEAIVLNKFNQPPKTTMETHPLMLFCADNQALTTNAAVALTWKEATPFEEEVLGARDEAVYKDVTGPIYPFVKVLFPVMRTDSTDSSEIFLSRGDIDQIKKNPNLYETVLFNFAVFMTYYGFRCSIEKTEQGKYHCTLLESTERPWWVQEIIEDDFNCFQRILESMTVFGFSGIAKLLLERLKIMSWQPGVSIKEEYCAEWAKAISPRDITTLPQVDVAPLDEDVLCKEYTAVLQKVTGHWAAQEKKAKERSLFKSAPDPLKTKMVADLYALMRNQQLADVDYDVASETANVLRDNLLAAAELARGYLFAGEKGIIAKDKSLSQLAYDILAAQKAVLSPGQANVPVNGQRQPSGAGPT